MNTLAELVDKYLEAINRIAARYTEEIPWLTYEHSKYSSAIETIIIGFNFKFLDSPDPHKYLILFHVIQGISEINLYDISLSAPENHQDEVYKVFKRFMNEINKETIISRYLFKREAIRLGRYQETIL